MNAYLANLSFTLEIVAPVFLIVFLGVFLKKIDLINDNFVSVSSKLVFNVTLPVLFFTKIASTSFSVAFNKEQVAFMVVGTLISFIAAWIISTKVVKDNRDKGVFVQGTFRGNFGIVGLAIIASMFGEDGLAMGAISLAFITPLYNIGSVVALTVPMREEQNLRKRQILLQIAKNPLIIAVVAAIPFALFQIPIHPILMRTGNYLSLLTLPLALLGIGGGLNFASVKSSSNLAMLSTALKLIIIPVLFVYGAYRLGFTGQSLGIIFVFFACPTAVASFAMADAMGANGKLAGNIILMTTLGSVVTMSLGVFILRSAGLI